jgi:DNA (cytosine-5)-methyltransferase 1
MTQPHGTETRYCSGCRCNDCRAGHAAGARRRRRAKAYGRHVPKSVPNVGVCRRVHALMCLGWSMRAQSRLLGWHPDRLGMMLTGDGVSPRNHARVAALYDRLWDTPPKASSKGERIGVSRTIALARRSGFQPPMGRMSLTVTDIFAGAGGSSTGMIAVPGVEVVIAANHWLPAIETHQANHPDTEHATSTSTSRTRATSPTTDVLWASPECTKWSIANNKARALSAEMGGDPTLFDDVPDDLQADDASEATRSRLLMFDVLRFIEHHRYRLVFVENVVDIATQAKYRTAWESWQRGLRKLGYAYRVVSLNSMHAQAAGAPAPQSRDRLYVVAWPAGEKAPDIEGRLRPKAWCPRCDRRSSSRGRRGRTAAPSAATARSTSTCAASCGTVVEPGWLPAASAIDWTLPGRRIGDRDKPLADKTRARIAAGIARYWREPFARGRRHTFEYRPACVTWPLVDASTLHGNHQGARRPGRGPRRQGRPADVDARTHPDHPPRDRPRRPRRRHVERRRPPDQRPAPRVHHPRRLRPGHAVHLEQPSTASRRRRPAADAHATATTQGCSSRSSPSCAAARPTPARSRPAVHRHRVRQPPRPRRAVLQRQRPRPARDRPDRHPHHPRPVRARHAQQHRRGDPEMLTPADEPMRTLTTTHGQQSLVTPGDMLAAEAQVDDCLFRMFEPHEVGAGMAFPDTYIWHGTRRVRVKLMGNAVTPPVRARERYYTAEDDGLSQSWANETVWCNPPYSDIAPWIRKAWQEWHQPAKERPRAIVMILPANRTEQAWWQDLVEPYRDAPRSRFTVEFLPGRIRFIKAGQTDVGPNERPPFGCCLLIEWTDDVWNPTKGCDRVSPAATTATR